MRQIYSFPVLLVLALNFLAFPGVKSANGQIIETLSAGDMLPSHLQGFEVDKPMIVVDQNKDDEYISVSRIFYRPHNDEAITLTLKDYSVNPQSYQKQVARLKRLRKSSDTSSVSSFKGNLMNTERRENYIEKGIYLGENKAVEVVHEGAISDTALSTTLLHRLDLDRIKRKL